MFLLLKIFVCFMNADNQNAVMDQQGSKIALLLLLKHK